MVLKGNDIIEWIKTHAVPVLFPSSFFLIEVLFFWLMGYDNGETLWTGLLWSFVFAGISMVLPGKMGIVFYWFSYWVFAIWALSQNAYSNVFGKMMWLTDIFYATDGVVYTETVFNTYLTVRWWICFALIVGMGILIQRASKININKRKNQIIALVYIVLSLILLQINNTVLAQNDKMYTVSTQTMYQRYGYYGMMMNDLYRNFIEPSVLPDRVAQMQQREIVTQYFLEKDASQKGNSNENAMTGIFEGKNIVFVFMEAIDDWMITQEETPTIYNLQQSGVHFTDFYTPYYGTTRSINTQTCLDTGFFFPTDGSYFFSYTDNYYPQTLAQQLKRAGYTSQMFHHNWPEFYHRNELVPALGYESYNSYAEECGEEMARNDCYVFDSIEMREKFFREGRVMNFIVTHAAHLPYNYEDPLSIYAFEKYPMYKGKYETEAEDCIRAKVQLVEELFCRLLEELSKEGQLENTVIIALSDHYPYGYKDMARLLEYNNATNLLMLENTPLFIWAADVEPMEVTKMINTSDLLPTLLNMFGITSQYPYLGYDAFDNSYPGYVFFPNGSWGTDGILCDQSDIKHPLIVQNKYQRVIDEDLIVEMEEKAKQFVKINNMLLTTDYYKFFEEEVNRE